VIQEVAKKLLDSTRSADLVCRYGGEEFCVVLPGLGLAAASAFAERLRERIDRECGQGVRDVRGLHVAVSIGVEALSGEVATAPALIDRADQALYRAKRSGRNCVRTFDANSARPFGGGDADPLGAFLSPSAFQDAFMSLLQDAKVRTGVLSGLKLAIDPYRALLAGHGIEAADRAVYSVAKVLRQCARPNDLLVRLDAEHLGVIAPGMAIQDALVFAELVRSRVETVCADAGGGEPGLRVTISAGVDSLPANALGASTLIERAAKALLRARRGGNNRVSRFAVVPAAAGGAEGMVPARVEESLP